MVDDAAVDLFGHAVVEAAVARLHVADADAHALGDERGEAGVRVAEDEDRVGLLGAEELLGTWRASGRSGRRIPRRARPCSTSGSRSPSSRKNMPLSRSSKFWPVWTSRCVARLVEDLDHARQADDLRARAQQGDDLGHLTPPGSAAPTTSGILRLEEARELAGAHQGVRGTVVAHDRRLVHRAGQLGEHRAQRVVALLAGDRARGLLLGEQDLVDLLAGADAGDDRLDVAIADEVRGQVGHPGARAARDVGLAGGRGAHRREDRVDRVLEREQEARHVGGRDGDGAAGGDLVEEQRDHGAARGQDVAIARADEARLRAARILPSM